MNLGFLPNQFILSQQSKFLNSKTALFNLFDSFQAPPPFVIPENSLVITLDNITFGPDNYTMVIPQNTHQTFKIIYYSLLFYIFERNPENKGIGIYQKLLQYILTHDMSLYLSPIPLSDEQIKTYLIKFLHLLFRQKCKHKLIITQLRNLPPMDFLLLHLIQQITGHQTFNIQINAFDIHQSLKKQLGFTIEFLNNELFIFENEYVIDIRQFDSSCEFYIRHEKVQAVNKIRDDIMMAQSAHFNNQSSGMLCGAMENSRRKAKTNIRLIKKSTIQSIDWLQECDEVQFQEYQQPLEFGGHMTYQTLAESQPLDDQTQKYVTERFGQTFDIISPYKDSIKIGNNSGFQSIMASNKESTKIINNNSGFQAIMASNRESTKIGDNNSGFQTIMASNVIDKSLGVSQSKSLKSISCRRTQVSQIKHSTTSNIIRSSINYPYSNKDYIKTHRYNHSFLEPRVLAGSYSTQCIKTDGFTNRLLPQRQQRRVPTFILQRANAKRYMQSPSLMQEVRANRTMPNNSSKLPKIMFSYKAF